MKAVERILRTISNRADYLDLEQEVCRAVGPSAAVWKLRSYITLIVSGPCALGMAVNDALGKKDLMSKFEPGWLLPDTEQNHINSDIGDALILLGDRQDMGTFRFSDVDRNLIVASTDMPSLSKGSFDKQTINRKKHAHYSKTEYASDVYGENGVYVDRLVTNEEVWIDSIDND